MANYTPQQMAGFLRLCAKGFCSDACPWAGVETKCQDQMMRDAADLLEEVAEDG